MHKMVIGATVKTPLFHESGIGTLRALQTKALTWTLIFSECMPHWAPEALTRQAGRHPLRLMDLEGLEDQEGTTGTTEVATVEGAGRKVYMNDIGVAYESQFYHFPGKAVSTNWM